MASSKKDNEGVQISAIHDKVSENYTKLSDEFVKSRQQHLQAILGLQQEYLESIKVAVKTTISVQSIFQIRTHATRSLTQLLRTWRI